MPKKRKKITKKKKRIKVEEGMAYIHSTFNNTIITMTNLNGDVLCWSSAGEAGFKGTKKGTPFAAQKTAEQVARKAKEGFQLGRVRVVVKGPGSGRETAIRTLQAAGLRVISIKEATPIPHNGCRPPKKRKV
ncbi:30S ribosomal protein S11 [Candidatus Aerophobetes bacterium]|jgi:small subunit ribosomal protein S11|uniref:Small ribosomal subunit protein uS11 n=1 Tax=Aerophobetes bacterium TaxID=2030807 RepID=A0A523YRV4_UNCAE|nr:30S ribosomal protein S11 [Candidatus Aerophobetes bacterium]TET94237.1 MAG: 30S ribosomal protein S11 [Candidatus Aerophobetes bacterium]TKJ45851.1 MAG: 30S ribosomal protein S11 [Candidatus Aerophobetes bacterium Ae_b3b]